MEGIDRLPRSRAFSDYASQPTHDWSSFYQHPANMSSYHQSTATMSYMSGGVSVQYPNLTPPYPAYSPSYPASTTSQAMYQPPPTSSSMMYSVTPPPLERTLPSQPLYGRVASRPSFCPTQNHVIHPRHMGTRSPPVFDLSILETEEQDSANRDTGKSEPIEPPLIGFPKVEDFDELMKSYVDQLSPKKQDKALIGARRAANIKAVLIDKKTTAVESAQFRFWVKKMFALQPGDETVHVSRRRICHENKPVAIREKLFKILTRAHDKCQHGGRDKTSAQVRRVYSWVPKELISRFVKLCPTCQVRRGLNRSSPSIGKDDMDIDEEEEESEEQKSPVKRRQSAMTASDQEKVDISIPSFNGHHNYGPHQTRWLSSYEGSQTYEPMYSPETSSTSTTTFSPVNLGSGYNHNAGHSHASTLKPLGSRPAKRFKQETSYCY